MANEKRYEKRKNKAIRIAFAAGCLALIAAGIFIFAFTKNSRNHDYLNISGVADNASIDITLEQKGATRSLIPEIKDATFFLSAPENLPTGDYILSATMHEDGKYKDVRFRVNRSKGHVSVIASGFAPKESLSFDQKSGLHFDWNGRIELQQSFSVKDVVSLCLETEKGLNICHTVKGGAV